MRFLNKLLPILLTLLLVACTNPVAPTTDAGEAKLDCAGVAPLEPTLERCKSISNLATFVMTERQNSTPITSVVDTLVKDNKYDELSEYIVFEAYSGASYHSERSQKREILEFGNRIYMECIQSIKEDEENNKNKF